MSRPHLASCPGIEVFNWRKGFKEWEISWIRHGDHDQPSLEATTDSFDVTIFHSTELIRYYGSGAGADRNSCCSCIEHLESSFKLLSFWWEPLYLDSNGHFGYQEEIDEDSAIVSVSMYHLLPFVRYY